jgi:hypothetical protein
MGNWIVVNADDGFLFLFLVQDSDSGKHCGVCFVWCVDMDT